MIKVLETLFSLKEGYEIVSFVRIYCLKIIFTSQHTMVRRDQQNDCQRGKSAWCTFSLGPRPGTGLVHACGKILEAVCAFYVSSFPNFFFFSLAIFNPNMGPSPVVLHSYGVSELPSLKCLSTSLPQIPPCFHSACLSPCASRTHCRNIQSRRW